MDDPRDSLRKRVEAIRAIREQMDLERLRLKLEREEAEQERIEREGAASRGS